MADYHFSIHERWAVWDVHGEACYLCREPVDMQSMQVDHVIPEHLIGKAKLPGILTGYGLPSDFDLNSYENWLPACAACNNRKRGTVFRATPIVQLDLQRAFAGADDCRQKEREAVGSRRLSLAITHVERAAGADQVDFDTIRPILDIAFQKYKVEMERMMAAASSPTATYTIGSTEPPVISLTPFYTVVMEGDGYRIVQGPYGTGAAPSVPNPHSSFYCGHCGSLGPWNGARCMSCGYLDDGD